MQPSHLIRAGTRTFLKSIYRRLTMPPPPTTTPIQQLLTKLGADVSECARFQEYLRRQGILVQSTPQQELKKAWKCYVRVKRFP